MGLCRLYNPVPLVIPLLLVFQGFHPNPEKLVKISLDYLGQNIRFDKLLKLTVEKEEEEIQGVEMGMVDQDRVIK